MWILVRISRFRRIHIFCLLSIVDETKVVTISWEIVYFLLNFLHSAGIEGSIINKQEVSDDSLLLFWQFASGWGWIVCYQSCIWGIHHFSTSSKHLSACRRPYWTVSEQEHSLASCHLLLERPSTFLHHPVIWPSLSYGTATWMGWTCWNNQTSPWSPINRLCWPYQRPWLD